MKKIVKNKLKSLDTLILNAGGVESFGYFEDLSIEDWKKTIDLNIIANVELLKIFLPLLKKNKESTIIFIGSAVSTNPGYSNPHYISVKSANLALAKHLSLAYASYNIRVNTISPGPVETESLLNNIKNTKPKNKNLESYKKEFINSEISKIPLKKLIKVKDIARYVIFLTSSDAGSITGQNIIIDGGKNRHI